MRLNHETCYLNVQPTALEAILSNFMLQFIHYIIKLWVCKWLIFLRAFCSKVFFALFLKIRYLYHNLISSLDEFENKLDIEYTLIHYFAPRQDLNQ